LSAGRMVVRAEGEPVVYDHERIILAHRVLILINDTSTKRKIDIYMAYQIADIIRKKPETRHSRL